MRGPVSAAYQDASEVVEQRRKKSEAEKSRPKSIQGPPMLPFRTVMRGARFLESPAQRSHKGVMWTAVFGAFSESGTTKRQAAARVRRLIQRAR